MKDVFVIKRTDFNATVFAFLAAALYALSSPISKLLLQDVSEVMMAAFLYLGAGAGLAAVWLVQKISGLHQEELQLTKSDMPYTVGMVLLDITAPILLMLGLSKTSAANVSLLNNFEVVSTAFIASFIFGEHISKRLWFSLSLVTLASVILSFDGNDRLSFSPGSLCVLLASICWGLENNCTRKISGRNPVQIVVIKGLCCGCGSFVIALVVGESMPKAQYILFTLLLGFVSYGLSIYLYVYAQRYLGAAKTSAYYLISPFVGAAISLIIFEQIPSLIFIVALIIMLSGTYLSVTDKPS